MRLSNSDLKNINAAGTETGVVSFYNQEKGLGQITNDKDGKPIMVFQQDNNGLEITDGQKVTFDIGESRRGPKALNVSRIIE